MKNITEKTFAHAKLVRNYTNIIIISIILSLVLAGACAAAANVTYHVDSSDFEKSKATVLQDFSSFTNITTGNNLTYTSSSFVADTIDGNGGIKLSHNYSGAVTTGWLRWDYPTINMSNVQNIYVSCYVENINDISRIRWEFANNTLDTKYALIEVNATSNHNRIRNGWNTFVFDVDQFTYQGNQTKNDTVVRTYVMLYPVSGHNASVIFDEIGVNYNLNGSATVLMTFDDGRQFVYDYAYPIMKERGIPGTMYVITSRPGTLPGLAMNTTALHDMRNNGWDIGSHTQDHVELQELSPAGVETQMANSHAWLVDNDFGLSSAVMAYPFGGWNNSIANTTANYFLLARSTNVSTCSPHLQGYSTTEAMTIRQLNVFNNTPVSTVEYYIDHAVKQKGMLVLLFHDVTPDGNTSTYDYNQEQFRQICDYIVASDIEPVVMTDYLKATVPNNTILEGEVTRCYANGNRQLVSGYTYPARTSDTIAIDTTATVDFMLTADDGNITKTWVMSSDTHDATVRQLIGGFPANYELAIYRDSHYYATTTTNSTGYLDWTYSGGFSTHTFSTGDFSLVSETAEDVNAKIWSPFLGMLAVLVLVIFATPIIRSLRGSAKLSSEEIMGMAGGLIAILVMCVIGAVILSAF